MKKSILAITASVAALLLVASAAPAWAETAAAKPDLAKADLAKAVAQHNTKKIQKLLDAGAAIDEADGENRTAFFHAAAQGDLALMQTLADKGAAIDHRDKTGATPLIAALRNPASQTPAIQFLLGKGAEVNAADEGGHTPLMEAVLRAPGTLDTDGQVALVSSLLAAGADPNKIDVSGAGALHHAAYVGEPRKVLELLLVATKDTGATTVSGANVLMMAAQNHQRANVDYLLARGFRPVRIKAAPGDKPALAQDISLRANALAGDWWGQYATRKGDPASAKAAFASAADDYDAAAAEARRLTTAYEAELVKDKQARNNQRAAAGVATVLSAALTLGAGYYVIYIPALATKVEEDERAIALFKAETAEFTARATALRGQLASN